MDITYRSALRDDLDPALSVVARAIDDLRVRHGFQPMSRPQAPRFQNFCLAQDAEGLWVAESGNTIVGFGFSWMLQKFWFLSQLFISPDAQARGVGQALLSR